MTLYEITILILIMCVLGSIVTTGICITCLRMINELEREIRIVKKQKGQLEKIIKRRNSRAQV